MTTPEAVIDTAKCEKDHLEWSSDIEVWKRDHVRALEMLQETADFIRRHDLELAEHLREIAAHEQQHLTGRGPTEQTKRVHLDVKERHNSFRGRHKGLMEAVVKLRVALHKAAHGRVLE